jgi:hypothetical protein
MKYTLELKPAQYRPFGGMWMRDFIAGPYHGDVSRFRDRSWEVVICDPDGHSYPYQYSDSAIGDEDLWPNVLNRAIEEHERKHGAPRRIAE